MATEARRDVFQAIADPTRRQIIQLIAQEGMNVNALSGQFNISRPAISQHVKILAECGLLIVRRQGRERICEARLDALGEVATWIGQYRQFWNRQLDALEQFLQQTEDKKPAGRKAKTSPKHK